MSIEAKISCSRSIRNTLQATQNDAFAAEGGVRVRTRKVHIDNQWNRFQENHNELMDVTQDDELKELYRQAFDTTEQDYLNAIAAINDRFEQIENQERQNVEPNAAGNANANNNIANIAADGHQNPEHQLPPGQAQANVQAQMDPPVQENVQAPVNPPVQYIAVGQQQPIPIIFQYPQMPQHLENTWGEFDGTLSQWQGFYERFCASVHNDPNISNAYKFQKLRSSLKGKALAALGEWQLTDQNYVEALDRLRQLFERQYYTSRELWWKFRNLPTLDRANGGMLQKLSNVTHEVTRQFRAMGYPVEHYDLIFVHELHDKLDNETAKAWELQRNTEDPTLQDLLDFLDKQAKALIGSRLIEQEGATNRKRPNHFDDRRNDAKRAKFESTPERKDVGKPNKNECRCCKEKHALIHCAKFKKLSLSERKKLVRDHELCLNCLKPFHMAKDCYAGACVRCQVKHNTLLCHENPMNKSVNTVQVQSKKEVQKKETKKVKND